MRYKKYIMIFPKMVPKNIFSLLGYLLSFLGIFFGRPQTIDFTVFSTSQIFFPKMTIKNITMSQGKSLYPVWGNLVYSDYRDKGLYPETTIAMNNDSSLKIKLIPISL
ncbi:MAG: hypothetical protein MR953_09125, partial [Butyrivibrio crossotus]|nr:hypothetical protein [Butyrivibrio crossotus]